MALTEQQKNSIMRLDADTLFEVLHECADQLMTAKEYAAYTKTPIRTVYDKIKSKDLKSTEIFGIKLIHM